MSIHVNTHTATKTIELIKDYLIRIDRTSPIKLLDKAIEKARDDREYAFQLEETLCHGSTVEYRKLFSPFGDYWGDPCPKVPGETHSSYVNAIDTAMLHIKCGDMDKAISDYNFLHNS